MNQELSSEHRLTRAGEDYLEAIYRITLEEGSTEASIRSVDVAEQLGVSKASVNKALTMLKEAGMVEQSRYGKVVLTAEGEDYAREVWRAHRALRAFLVADLGVERDVADEEACLMEHVLSRSTMRKLVKHLEEQGVIIAD